MSLGVWEASKAVGARMVPVMALDFNETALGVYKDNFPGVWALSAPIESVLDGPLGTRPSRSERQLSDRIGQVDLVVGGPPCLRDTAISTTILGAMTRRICSTIAWLA